MLSLRLRRGQHASRAANREVPTLLCRRLLLVLWTLQCLCPAALASSRVLRVVRSVERSSCGDAVSDFSHAVSVELRDGEERWIDLDAPYWRIDQPVLHRGADGTLRARDRLVLRDGALIVESRLRPSAGRFELRLAPQRGPRFDAYLARHRPALLRPCEAEGSLRVRDAAPDARDPERSLALHGLLRRAAHGLLHRDLPLARASLERARALHPGSAEAAWMLARTGTVEADAEPLPAARTAALRVAEAQADRAVALDPGSAEGHLWRGVARGRILGERGGPRSLLVLLGFGRGPRFVAESFERALELGPAYDYLGDSAEADARFAAAKLLRRVPDSRLVELLVGVRGDLDRAIPLAERAHALRPGRLDYALELAAGLLCRGARRAREADIERARALLGEVATARALNPEEERERSLARRLLAGDPARGCDAA